MINYNLKSSIANPIFSGRIFCKEVVFQNEMQLKSNPGEQDFAENLSMTMSNS